MDFGIDVLYIDRPMSVFYLSGWALDDRILRVMVGPGNMPMMAISRFSPKWKKSLPSLAEILVLKKGMNPVCSEYGHPKIIGFEEHEDLLAQRI